LGTHSGFFGNMWGQPGSILSSSSLLGQAHIPEFGELELAFPESTLAYFQIVFAAITPLLMLGSVLGRINFKAWIPFVALWTVLVYTVNAFLIWGGGFFAQHGAVDFSGGYVIHLAAGVSGFVAAAVIGGTSLLGGRGGVVLTTMAAFVLTFIDDVVAAQSLSVWVGAAADAGLLLVIVGARSFLELRRSIER